MAAKGGNDNLPSLTSCQSRSTHHDTNSQFSLTSLTLKQHSLRHKPVQQSEEPLLSPRIAQIVHDQKPRKITKYMPHPPLKDKHHGDQITDARAKQRKTKAFLRAKHSGNEEIKSEAIIKGDEKGFSYDISPEACLVQSYNAAHATTSRLVMHLYYLASVL